MRTGTVAIMPPGALGVSFFYHLTSELKRLNGDTFFVGLDGSRSTNSLLRSGLQVSDSYTIRNLPGSDFIVRDLGEVWKMGKLPELLIACPNPDQLLQVISTFVALIERIWAADSKVAGPPIPILVLSSNGIYFQRVRQMFIEKLEESTLLGRLPDLWPDQMPRIVGHLVRGVTVQTGVRIGAGADTIYYPGPSGISLLAGGGSKERQRCHELLAGMGIRIEIAEGTSPTRLEFEKAIINLVSNLLGLIYALQEDGSFEMLTVGDVLAPERQAAARELAHRVFEVGVAVKAFNATDDFDAIYGTIFQRMQGVSAHTPSSLQAIGLQIQMGTLEAKCPPTEKWLIDPLLHYARSAGLTDAVEYFERLLRTLIEKLAKVTEFSK
jgi:hypothetical protein